MYHYEKKLNRMMHWLFQMEKGTDKKKSSAFNERQMKYEAVINF